MNVIELSNVSWHRDTQMILNEINWTVKEREHWSIIGANGAGKTALLNIVSGYMWPSTGTVKVLGQPFGRCDLRELRKSIGWVSVALFEKYYRFHQGEKAIKVVISGKHASIGIYETISQDDVETAQQLLEQFNCHYLAEKPFGTLSHGEKQRVLLARAWMASPRLLILDEACTGLDLLAREQLLQAVNALAADPAGPTILYVTHHVEEILPVFTHALLLKNGKILAKGERKKIFTDALLSELFGIDLTVTWQHDRPWVKLA